MPFICEICTKQFSRKFTLQRHQNDAHKCAPEPKVAKWSCTLCDFEGSPKNIDIHYETQHGLVLKKEVLRFVDENSFHDWKHDVEKQTVCKYLLMRGEQNGVRRYFCHRSGKFVSKGQGIRRIKTQRSKKIEGYCPAHIIVRKDEKNPDYLIEVEFWSTHVGHKNELCHVTLSPNTKQKIASKLQNKIPGVAIIDEVRNTVVSDELEQVHLLTDTDIYNISKEFTITAEFQKDKNDAVSVHKYVTELRESNGGSSVLYYKPQDSIDEKSVYEVTRNPNNVHSSCKLLCEDCGKTCIHQYVCTCVDNMIKYNMCKHIHHVIQNCLNLCNNVPDPSQRNEESAHIDSNNSSLNKAIISELRTEESLKEADEYYAKGKSFCTNTRAREFFIQEQKKLALKMECSDFKAFSPKKCLKRAAELKQSRGIKNSTPRKRITLTPQKKLYSTKKKQTVSSNNKHQAPSTHVKDGISASLFSMISTLDFTELFI